MSVLPKNRQLAFSIQNYIWDTSEIFSISSDLTSEDFLMSFLCFRFVFRPDFLFYFRNTHIYIIQRKLHVALNIWNLSSRGKNIWRVSALTSEIFFPLEDKLHSHMFAPPWNILYLCTNKFGSSYMCVKLSSNSKQ